MANELTSYAQQVVSSGGVTSVHHIGGNEVLYELPINLGNATEGDAEEAIINHVESQTRIDSERYDTWYKVGDRFFHLVYGAGAGIVEMTDWFKKHVPITKPLASGETAMESEIQNIRRLAGITEDAPGLSPGAQMIIQHTLDAVQDLDEMGGVTSYSDYILAMETLIAELQKRRDTAADIMQSEGNLSF